MNKKMNISIDHVAIYVLDLEEAKNFFMRYFCAVEHPMYHNPRTGLTTYFLSFEKGARIELMNRPNVSSSIQSEFETGYTHISFCVGGREEVNQLTEQLRKDGYTILSEPRVTGDNYYESTILGPEGICIEITE